MSNSDENAKKPGVPSWQLQPKPAEGEEGEQSAPEQPSRETVIEQAKKFLEEDEVRNASTDKKIAFLESKGLQSEEIQELLGVTRNPEATAPPEPPASPTPNAPPIPETHTPSTPAPTQPTYTPQLPSAPPIITYPEFLTIPTSPEPLVTKSRLLTTLYLFGGLSALLYGTNTYLIEPMLSTLTTSRLEFAETANSNLRKLISKLEGLVSEIPATHTRKGVVGVWDEEKEDSEDEDPTEMFHRDVGIQTSPPQSRPSSPPPTATHFSEQTKHLTTLSTSLSTLIEDSTVEGQETSDLSATISILREYLDGLAYVAPNYGYGGYGSSVANVKEIDDEIGRVKASIRGVKGVLLSARSFPGGVGGRVR